MGIEDQKEEREVLESIFPDEITGMQDTPHYLLFSGTHVTSADVSDTEFRILIKLDVGEPSYGEYEDDDEEDTSRMYARLLTMQIPANKSQLK